LIFYGSPKLGLFGENFEHGTEDPEFRREISSRSDARLLGLHLNLLSLLKGPAGKIDLANFLLPDECNISNILFFFRNNDKN